MACFFEERNHSKSLNRLGEKDHETCKTEKLLLLNSFAKSVGYPDDELPYSAISAPTINEEYEEEYMGFSYRLATIGATVTNPTQDIQGYERYNADEEEVEETVITFGESDDPVQLDDADEGHEPVLDTLEEDDEDFEFLEQLDVEVVTDYVEPDPESMRLINDAIEDLDRAEAARVADNLHRCLIADELRKLLPDENTTNESTLDAFKRLANKQPWIPFRDPASKTEATPVDIAEAELFHRWKGSYRRDGKASGPRGYKSFERAWNNEVSRRFTLLVNGDQDIVLLTLKSCSFLQTYLKQSNEYESLQSIAGTADNDTDMNQLNDQLRVAQRTTQQQVVRHRTTPTTYYGAANANTFTPFGHPNVLNAHIAVGTLRGCCPPAANNLCTPTPFNLHRPAEATAPIRERRGVFRTRMLCKTCGFIRNDHDKDIEGVAETCKRDYCGNCMDRLEFRKNDGFGPTCKRPTHTRRTEEKKQWYEYKVRKTIYYLKLLTYHH